MRTGLRALLPLVCAISAIASPGAGIAQQATPLSDGDLSEMRGGFLTADGITFGFGAMVRTYVDGQLAMESRLTWTETGVVTQQDTSGVVGAVNLSQVLDAAMAQGLDLAALQQGQGLLLSDASGATAIVHNLQNGAIQSLIVNNADGRNIRQDIDLTVTLPNMDTMQRSYSIGNLGAQIGQDINSMLLQGLGR